MDDGKILFEALGIRYSVARSADLPEMTRLLGETFARHDPPAVAVGLAAQEFERLVEVFSQTAALDELTVIARDAVSGDMAGALLTDDFASSLPLAGVEGLSPKFGPIIDLFGQLDDEYRVGKTIEPGEYLHLFLLGVSERFTRRGVAQQLVTACLTNGAQHGYRVAVAEATGRVSQHIFSKKGFKARAQVSYVEYRSDDGAVFESIAEHGGPKAMERQIPTTD